MPVSTFNGVSLFGYAIKMTNNVSDRSSQKNAYPGLAGVEHIDLGSRGRTTIVRGRLFASSVANLMAAKTLMESYHDGLPYSMYDTAGLLWTNCLMGPVKMIDRWTHGGSIGFQWAYEVEITHLTYV
jgi:hypothetical protein